MAEVEKRFKTSQRQIAVRHIRTDAPYQRPVRRSKVEEIKAKLNLDALGVIHVSMRANAEMYAIDGKQRITTLMELGMEDYHIDCIVYHGLTVEEEAQLFRWLDTQSPISSVENFLAGVQAKDARCLDIVATVSTCGLCVTQETRPDAVRAVGALEKLYDLGVLEETLRVNRSAWPEEQSALCNYMLMPVGLFIARHNGAINEGVLVRRLAETDPHRIKADGTHLRQVSPSPISLAIANARIVTDLYNYGRKAKDRLEYPA